MTYFQERRAEIGISIADELRGIVPKVTVSGRKVINDDPPIVHISDNRRGTGNVGRVINLLNSGGQYSARDVDITLGLKLGQAHCYLNKLEKRGQARRVGKRSGMKKGQPETVWAAPEND